MIWLREQYKLVVQQITIYCILHNLFINLKNNWDKKKDQQIKKEINCHNWELLAISWLRESIKMMKREIIIKKGLEKQFDSD